MSSPPFDAFEAQLDQQGLDKVFEQVGQQLESEGKFHELFDVLLMRSRHALGLPAVLTTPLDELDERVRAPLEDAYLAACRTVGTLLLDDGRLREAWMYLRPVGDRGLVAAALARVEPTDENLQDLIEIGLYEGVAPALGYALVLKNYGTCNAITTFEGAVLNKPRPAQQAAAGLLVRHLHGELLANVRADVARQEGREPQEGTLAELVRDRDWLLADNNYHTDTTHLAATVRFARLLEDHPGIELAYDLTEYGRRLSEQFRFPGEEPFADVYPAHALFFAAQLGRQVDEAVEYFRARAAQCDVEEAGTAAVEVYVALLARLGRHAEAVRASLELLPPQARTSGFAPHVLELARLAGDYEPLLAACRQRGDLVGFTAALAERKRAAPG